MENKEHIKTIDQMIDVSDKKQTVGYLNIYHENSEKIKEYYIKMRDIYNSIKIGISAEEEIDKFFEIVKLDFHTIPLNKDKGEKYMFLKGFLKGLDWGRDIVKNRKRLIEEQAEHSTAFDCF